MKFCNNSANCCWGNAFKENCCAYKDDMHENDECPMWYEEADIKMERICGNQVGE